MDDPLQVGRVVFGDPFGHDKTHRVAMPPVFEVPPYRADPAQPLTLSDMQRLVAQLAAPPSDKERLWQAMMAAIEGSYASEYDDLVIVSLAFDIAECAVLQFHKRVARLDAMGWRTEGGE